MTIEQLEKANGLMQEIRKEKNKKHDIESLSRRMEEITGPHAKTVNIKLGEGWCYTPVAEVSIDEFRKFIDFQKVLIQENIVNLELQFEEL